MGTEPAAGLVEAPTLWYCRFTNRTRSCNNTTNNLVRLVARPTTITGLHPLNGLFSRTTWVSRYKKGRPKTSLFLNEASEDRMMGFWDVVASAGPCAICTSLQTDNHNTTTYTLS